MAGIQGNLQDHGGARRGAGRPKGSKSSVYRKRGSGQTLTEMCQAHSLELVPIALELAKDRRQPGHVRLAAINSIWDRAHGRPKQTIEGAGMTLILATDVLDPKNAPDVIETDFEEVVDRIELKPIAGTNGKGRE